MGVSFYGSSSAVEAANVNINSGGFEWILDLLKLTNDSRRIGIRHEGGGD